MRENANQYPHIRAMTICISCSRPKAVGLLLCWRCHNDLKMIHDDGYGPVMQRVLETANHMLERSSITKT